MAVHADDAEQQQGGKPVVVAEILELSEDRLRGRFQRGEIGLTLPARERHTQLGDPDTREGQSVAARARKLERQRHVSGAALQIPDPVERVGELDKDRRAICRRSQRQRALEKPDRRGVVALGCPVPSGAKAGRRTCGKLRGGRLWGAELAPEQDGALEVVAEQLIGHRQG